MRGSCVRQVGLKEPLAQRFLVTKALGSDKLGWRSLWLRGFWLQRPLGQTSWVEGAFGSEVFGYKGPWVRQAGLKESLAQRFLVTKALGSDKLGWRSLWLRGFWLQRPLGQTSWVEGAFGSDKLGLTELGLKDFKSWGSRAGVGTCQLHGGMVAFGMVTFWHDEVRTMVTCLHVDMFFALRESILQLSISRIPRFFGELPFFLRWPRSSRWGTGRQDKWWPLAPHWGSGVWRRFKVWLLASKSNSGGWRSIYWGGSLPPAPSGVLVVKVARWRGGEEDFVASPTVARCPWKGAAGSRGDPPTRWWQRQKLSGQSSERCSSAQTAPWQREKSGCHNCAPTNACHTFLSFLFRSFFLSIRSYFFPFPFPFLFLSLSYSFFSLPLLFLFLLPFLSHVNPVVKVWSGVKPALWKTIRGKTKR